MSTYYDRVDCAA